jgi:hypothetical protein
VSRRKESEIVGIADHHLLPCENMHVDVQADLNRKGWECSGISMSNVGSAPRPLDSPHAAENKEAVEQIDRHV